MLSPFFKEGTNGLKRKFAGYAEEQLPKIKKKYKRKADYTYNRFNREQIFFSNNIL